MATGEVTTAEASGTEVDVPTGPVECRTMMRNLESKPSNPFVLAEKEISSIICKLKIQRLEL